VYDVLPPLFLLITAFVAIGLFVAYLNRLTLTIVVISDQPLAGIIIMGFICADRKYCCGWSMAFDC
jgi:hypothetical protein